MVRLRTAKELINEEELPRGPCTPNQPKEQQIIRLELIQVQIKPIVPKGDLHTSITAQVITIEKAILDAKIQRRS